MWGQLTLIYIFTQLIFSLQSSFSNLFICFFLFVGSVCQDISVEVRGWFAWVGFFLTPLGPGINFRSSEACWPAGPPHHLLHNCFLIWPSFYSSANIFFRSCTTVFSQLKEKLVCDTLAWWSFTSCVSVNK